LTAIEWLVFGDTLLFLGGAAIAVDAWRKAARAEIVARQALTYAKIDKRDPLIVEPERRPAPPSG
jgi:hypothetical protein